MFKLMPIGILAGLALAGAGLQAADNTLSAAEKAAGWRLMFDGKTFAGWDDPARKSPPGDAFTIENGCIKASAKPRITEDLFTTDTFRDFEMEFDWKISPGGNTGIKYLIQGHFFVLDGAGKFEDRANASLKAGRKDRLDHGQDYVVGFEYQLLDNALNPDARRGATHQAGALYDMAAASKDMTKPVGEWNHSRLVVKGEHVEHWMNGVKVVDFSLDSPSVAQGTGARWGVGSPIYEMLVKHPRRDCPISLQDHETEAWFKNLKLRRLE